MAGLKSGQVSFDSLDAGDDYITLETRISYDPRELGKVLLKAYQKALPGRMDLPELEKDGDALKYSLNGGTSLLVRNAGLGIRATFKLPEAEKERLIPHVRRMVAHVPDLSSLEGETGDRMARLIWEIRGADVDIVNPFEVDDGISPIYFKLERLGLYPEAKRMVAEELFNILKGLEFDMVAGGQGRGRGLTERIADRFSKPGFWIREAPPERHKEAGRLVGPKPSEVYGKTVLVGEETIYSGNKKGGMIKYLRDECGAIVNDCFAVLEREEGKGREALAEMGVKLHSLTTMKRFMDLEMTYNKEYITIEEHSGILAFIRDREDWRRRHEDKASGRE